MGHSGRRTLAAGGAACAIAAAVAVAGAGAQPDAFGTSFDAHWLRTGARADVFTIATSRLAAEKAVDPALRQAAQAVVDSQLQVLARRTALARSLRVPLPKRTDPVQTLQINQLSATSGDPAIFEPLYAHTQEAALQLAVQETAEAARGAATPKVRKLAASLLPVLKRNLQTLAAIGQ